MFNESLSLEFCVLTEKLCSGAGPCFPNATKRKDQNQIRIHRDAFVLISCQKGLFSLSVWTFTHLPTSGQFRNTYFWVHIAVDIRQVPGYIQEVPWLRRRSVPKAGFKSDFIVSRILTLYYNVQMM